MSTATLPFQRDADTIPPIEIADRCDRHPIARAVVATTIPHPEGLTTLYWCHHCYRQHQEKLLEIATAIRDESHTLTSDRLKGAHNG
jgi:hypothetical protein